MRYEYTVTKEGGEAEIMKAMSWKKLFKSLLLKYPKFSGWCTYMNKKGHLQQRSFNEGTAIITRIKVGITVHAISKKVLCVTFLGLGLALSLNLTMV